MSRKLRVGTPVVYHWDGQKLHAIVTKLWSNGCVNLTVFEESGSTTSRSSVTPPKEGMSLEGRWTWPEPETVEVRLVGYVEE
jgi:hypothetical protein